MEQENTSNSQGVGLCAEAVSALLCLGRFEQVPWLSGKDAPLVVKYDIEKPENGHVGTPGERLFEGELGTQPIEKL